LYCPRCDAARTSRSPWTTRIRTLKITAVREVQARRERILPRLTTTPWTPQETSVSPSIATPNTAKYRSTTSSRVAKQLSLPPFMGDRGAESVIVEGVGSSPRPRLRAVVHVHAARRKKRIMPAICFPDGSESSAAAVFGEDDYKLAQIRSPMCFNVG
jgi:hypothetical protein